MAIHEIVCHADFKQSQADFMMANFRIFEEDDENKLEYTSVFESYVQIMEQLIELRIKQQFSEQEYNEFLADFGANYNTYKQYESETVEILLDFVDFPSFKKTMLEYKKVQGQDQLNGDKGLTAEIDP